MSLQLLHGPRALQISAIAGAALLLVLSACSKPSTQAQAMGNMPPVPVSVAQASEELVPIQIRAIGTVEPTSSVQIKAQVAGELTAVKFTEGSDVAKDQLLFEIDARPYRDALAQAQAAVAKDRAQLAQAHANVARDQAQAKSAEADATRNEQLFKEGVGAQMQATQQRAVADAAQESVRADQAAIESAQAALESDEAAVARAKLDLSYCEIRSPVSGRAGNLLTTTGNLVKANDVAMVVINRIAPIFVSFGVPEEQLGAIKAKSGGKLVVDASSDSDPGHVAHGALTVIDNAVDPATGTIRLKAIFENGEHLLWPGEFVNVILTIDSRTSTVVPSEAVQDGQKGQFIFVVKKDQTVESRPVTVNRTIGRRAVITKGIAAGETVVTDGQLRLFPGAKIQPVPAGKVEDQAL